MRFQCALALARIGPNAHRHGSVASVAAWTPCVAKPGLDAPR
jgi:hypothetical protein